MDILKRIGAGILGFIEGYLIGGGIICLANNVDKFQGSVLGGVLGAIIGALFPISTLFFLLLLLPLMDRSRRDD